MSTRDSVMENAFQWIDQNRIQAIASVAILLCLVIAITLFASRSSDPAGGNTPAVQLTQQPEEDTVKINKQIENFGEEMGAGEALTIHVVGAVNEPGVYELKGGARVIDAVEAAGGLSELAYSFEINMAQHLVDGAQVRIPTYDEIPVSDHDNRFGVIAPEGSPDTSDRYGTNGGGQKLVNINTADASALETLPGVGPSTSTKIIAERELNGPYRSLIDLARVSGIGEKKIEALNGLAEAR